ncbi:MAG: hypothetical protein ACR2OJ_03530 [Hyphomicrobiales bacterium]
MNNFEQAFDPKKMNSYLAAGAQARSDAFAQTFHSIKVWLFGLGFGGKTDGMSETALKGA